MSEEATFTNEQMPLFVRECFQALSVYYSGQSKAELLDYAKSISDASFDPDKEPELGDSQRREMKVLFNTVETILKTKGDEDSTFDALKSGLQTIISNQGAREFDLIREQHDDLSRTEFGAVAAATTAAKKLSNETNDLTPEGFKWIPRIIQLACLNGLTHPISDNGTQILRLFLKTGETVKDYQDGHLGTDDLKAILNGMDHKLH